jgi:hypothetical protein
MQYSIKTWHDKHTKSWITQIKDEQGNQIGEAAYDGNKKSRDASIKEFKQNIKKILME